MQLLSMLLRRGLLLDELLATLDRGHKTDSSASWGGLCRIAGSPLARRIDIKAR